MKEVIFPEVKLSLLIDNIAFSIGKIDVYWYAILIISAIILVIVLLYKDDKKYGIKFEDVLELLIFMIPIAFIGARIYYICFKLDYYLADITRIFNIRDGGLAIYGGIIAGIVTIIVYCKIKKIKILDMIDYFAPYLPLGQAIGRWGNFFNVEAYGTETTIFFRMGIIENGIYKEVHPTFLYESFATFCIFILLVCIKDKRKYSGQITYIYLILYSFVRFFIEGLRIDSLMIGNIRILQLLSLLIFIIFLCVIIFKEIRRKKFFKKTN